MASTKHLAASHFVKSIHEKLRDEAKILGVDKAWQKHCKDEENLQKYASAMHDLATKHWENNYKLNIKTASRVEWVYQFCYFYFIQEEYLKQRIKECEIANKINLKINDSQTNFNCEKLKVLDVGSCYNPFQKYLNFEVLPIDIAPATQDVYKCDFLNVKIQPNPCKLIRNSEIYELEAEYFDVIVFSLLLEYLPSPDLRLLCCHKAYKLLKTEGILIIITPDSKHVGANAKIMKSWRYILAEMGFSRIKYEKLAHLHCMVFRKSLKVEIPQRWATLHKNNGFYNEFVIPQDFKKVQTNSDKTNLKRECDVAMFDELPHFIQ